MDFLHNRLGQVPLFLNYIFHTPEYSYNTLLHLRVCSTIEHNESISHFSTGSDGSFPSMRPEKLIDRYRRIWPVNHFYIADTRSAKL